MSLEKGRRLWRETHPTATPTSPEDEIKHLNARKGTDRGRLMGIARRGGALGEAARAKLAAADRATVDSLNKLGSGTDVDPPPAA